MQSCVAHFHRRHRDDLVQHGYDGSVQHEQDARDEIPNDAAFVDSEATNGRNVDKGVEVLMVQSLSVWCKVDKTWRGIRGVLRLLHHLFSA
eukprot:4114641-Amphidinium_carterae.1